MTFLDFLLHAAMYAVSIGIIGGIVIVGMVINDWWRNG